MFVKIFIWFWLAIVVSSLAVFATFFLFDDDMERMANSKEEKIFEYLLQHQNAKPIKKHFRARRLPHHWQLYKFNPQRNNSFLADEVLHELEEHQGQLIFLQLHRIEVLAGKEKDGWVYIALKKANWRNDYISGRKIAGPVVFILAITLSSLLLAWYLTRPIRRLQQATVQLAQGDFSLAQLRQQKNFDELGLLTQDFVVMADDLEKLLASHRQLLQDVSHELRSPLTRLRIALGIAQKKDEQQGQTLLSEHQKISRTVDQVEYLIANILDLAKLQQTKLLQAETFDLVAAIKDWLEDAEPELSAKQLSVTCHQTAAVINVHWDKALTQRAFDNVLRNAIRFSPEQTEIVIQLKIEDAGQYGQASWSVIDQGEGVAEGNLDKIFDAFVQEDQTRRHDKSGYGLGLALVKRIAQLHKGQVVARHNPAGSGGLIVKYSALIESH